MAKIVFLDIETLGEDVDLTSISSKGEFTVYPVTTSEKVVERIRDADIVITNKVVLGDKELSAAKNLKLIVVAATGYNNIDLGSARRYGIVVSNVRNYSTESVAQHTFAMLFYLLHQLRCYDDYVKSGEYAESKIFTHIGRPFYELKGKIWGIVGLGAIGRRVAEVAENFVREVIYFSTSGVERKENYRRVSLEYLLQNASIISIHAPLNERTEGLIGYNELTLMRKDAILLNLGRGGIVVEKDVAMAVDEGLICCFGTDVLSSEPISPENPLLRVRNRDRILITPHIAWTSIEARKTLVGEIGTIIEKFFNGEYVNRVV